MTNLADLFALADLDAAIADGFVRVQTHPTEPYRIFNYTEQAVYTRTWTPVTKQCRGLIADEAAEIIARPWPKFFNYGEHVADELDLSAPVEVTDKADGSLGILYGTSDGPAIATRGSFMSEQAQHATALYRGQYAGRWSPDADYTYLFEIVYRSNRIVLDYGDMDDLILLGAVHKRTGETFGPKTIVEAEEWCGPTTQVFTYETLADALAAEPRTNAEGLVVRYADGDLAGTMIKLKQADYVALHRIITGLTARRLWERTAIFAIREQTPDLPVKRLAHALRMDPTDVEAILAAGPDWQVEVEKTAPEEFTEWIQATIGGLEDQAHEIVQIVEGEASAWQGVDRREAAAGIADHPFKGMVFAALDGKPIVAQAWSEIRPDAERPFMARGEDVA